MYNRYLTCPSKQVYDLLEKNLGLAGWSGSDFEVYVDNEGGNYQHTTMYTDKGFLSTNILSEREFYPQKGYWKSETTIWTIICLVPGFSIKTTRQNVSFLNDYLYDPVSGELIYSPGSSYITIKEITHEQI